MDKKRKNGTRIKSLAAAASILLTMNPGMAAYADSASIADAAYSPAGEAGLYTVDGSAESAETEAVSHEISELDSETEGIIGYQGDPGTALYSSSYEEVDGSLYVSGGSSADGDFKFENGTLTVLSEKPLTISNKDSQNVVRTRIYIADGVAATLILNGVLIQPNDGAPISMGTSAAEVNIILADGSRNRLFGMNAASVEKLSKNGKLIISCEHADEAGHVCNNNCGFLEASCVSGHGAGIGASGTSGSIQTGGIYIRGGLINASGKDGAGIGGSNYNYVSDINISGGRIEAHGDNGSAGIGSAINQSIDSISISGGVISAYGSAYSTSDHYGAAIGAAYCSNFNSINISGGTIYADAGGCYSAGTGAVGIGAGNSSNDQQTGNITISGGSVYAVGGGSSRGIGHSNDSSMDCNIVITGGTVHAVNGSGCSSGDDVTSSVPTDGKGNELAMLCIDNPDVDEVTVNGVQYPSETTYYTSITSSGTIDASSYVYVPKSGLITVKVGDKATVYVYNGVDDFAEMTDFGFDIYATDGSQKLIYGVDYTYDPNSLVLTVLSDKGITIKNTNTRTVCKNAIFVADGVPANITLAGVNIKRNDNSCSAIGIASNSKSNVRLILADGAVNIIETNKDYAALSKNSDSDDCGELTITCQHSGENGHVCSGSCGSLYAITSADSAAIGGDYSKSVHNITIAGGSIYASSCRGAAIGGGKGADGVNINIANSVVYASCDSGAAVIGGGDGGKGSNIHIDESVVSLVQMDRCGYDMIGNSANDQGDAADIYITDSSVGLKAVNSGSVSQTSPIKSARTQSEVYPLTIANPDGAEVIVDGTRAVAYNNIAADSGDSNLYLWLEPTDHTIQLDMNEIGYHFNNERLNDRTADAFRLCEADISAGYRHNDSAHWYGCKGSDTCTVYFNYEKHTGGTATCTEKAVCTVCGTEYGNAPGHDMELFTRVEATCLTDGHLQYFYCTRCGKYFENSGDTIDVDLSTFIIPAKGHDLSKHEGTAPTCVAAGNKEYYSCADCGRLYTDDAGKNEVTLSDVTLAPTGVHSFGEWNITGAADCTNNGSRDRSCTECGETETETIEKLGHDFSKDWTTDQAAGCTTPGVKSHHCTRCDERTDITEIPAAGHSFGEWNITRAADCTNNGSRERSCTECGETETETIEKLGHDFSKNWTTDQAAGCTTPGVKSHHCTRCDERTDVTEIPAAGHKFGEWKVVVASTKDKEGLKQRTCAVCSAVEEQSIPRSSDSSGGTRVPSGYVHISGDDLPMVNGEAKTWGSICTDILGGADNGTIRIVVNDSRIPADVIRALADRKKTCEFVIGDSISIIVNGSKVTNAAGEVGLTSASGSIAGLRGRLAAKIGISGISFPFDIKVSCGSVENEKFVNLYTNSNGTKQLAGTAKLGTDRISVISVPAGGEFIAMACGFSDIPGDADNDGVMNAMDAAHLLRYTVGMCELNNPEMADLNLDGVVNAQDAAVILRRAVGL